MYFTFYKSMEGGGELKKKMKICNLLGAFPDSVCGYVLLSGCHVVLLSTQYCCLNGF